MYTVNVDIFTLYIFSSYSRISHIRENIYSVKITFIMPHRGSNIKNTNINQREMVNFSKCAKMYTRKKVYINSSAHDVKASWEIPWYVFAALRVRNT